MSAPGARLVLRMVVIDLAVVLIAPPTAAQAGSVVRPDPRGDVVKVGPGWAGPQGGYEVNPAPDRRRGDITRTRLQHTANRVRIRLTFADLRRQGALLDVNARVWTNEGVLHYVSLYARPGQWAGKVFMRSEGATSRCKVRHSVDYADNRVTISIPRACLSRPRWVQIAVSDLTSPINIPITPETEPVFWFRDDALRNGYGELTFSRRIYRG